MPDKPAPPIEGGPGYRGTGLPRNVKGLAATAFFQDVASEMVYPLLPRFLMLVGGGPALLGVMESVAEAALALIKGASGRWSDRAGVRKPFVVAGYALSALGRPLMALAANVPQVIAIRGLDRLGKGLRTAPREALISEVTPPGSRAYAFAFDKGLDHLGAAMGPLAAALLLTISNGNLRLVLGLATIPALIGWIVVQVSVHERDRPAPALRAPAVPAEGYSAALRRMRLPLAAFFVFSLGNASDAFLLLRASELGYSTVGLTLLWSGFHVAKWLASAPAGRLADRLGPGRPILVGWLIYAAVYVGFARARGPAELAGLFALYALFYGLTEGASKSMIVELSGDDVAPGTSLGLFHMVTSAGLFFASLLCGFLWQAFGPTPALLLGAALAAAASLMLTVARRQAG